MTLGTSLRNLFGFVVPEGQRLWWQAKQAQGGRSWELASYISNLQHEAENKQEMAGVFTSQFLPPVTYEATPPKPPQTPAGDQVLEHLSEFKVAFKWP